MLPDVPDELAEMYATDWKNCTDPTEKSARGSYGWTFKVPGVELNMWNTIQACWLAADSSGTGRLNQQDFIRARIACDFWNHKTIS